MWIYTPNPIHLHSILHNRIRAGAILPFTFTCVTSLLLGVELRTQQLHVTIFTPWQVNPLKTANHRLHEQ
jgi:hypothetical protein